MKSWINHVWGFNTCISYIYTLYLYGNMVFVSLTNMGKLVICFTCLFIPIWLSLIFLIVFTRNMKYDLIMKINSFVLQICRGAIFLYRPPKIKEAWESQLSQNNILFSHWSQVNALEHCIISLQIKVERNWYTKMQFLWDLRANSQLNDCIWIFLWPSLM